MPRRRALTGAQLANLLVLPAEEVTLVRHWTLGDADLAAIGRRRRDHNRLGFALQLCALRYPGRPLRPGEAVPKPALRFVADQVGAAPEAVVAYGTRAQTRSAHLDELRDAFGFTDCTPARRRELAAWLLPVALATTSAMAVAAALLEPPLNHKRIFRLMRLSSMLLQPHTGRRPIRAHEGTVVAPASNQRWASDGLEISCWNGEVVRIAFAIETHDREIIAWVATSGGGISGEMIRDMMLDCVERRFEAIRAPQPVQWLADNGSAYTAAETTDFAAALNLVPCFTPVRSPESNGVCEAFVKTLKRDYARVNPRPDAISVLQQIPARFEDYNTVHPHSGLRMRSPREFIAEQSANQAACPV